MAVTLHTSLGDVKIELFCDRAPKSCENFLALAASHYYDNTAFHRNIKGACAARWRGPAHASGALSSLHPPCGLGPGPVHARFSRLGRAGSFVDARAA